MGRGLFEVGLESLTALGAITGLIYWPTIPRGALGGSVVATTGNTTMLVSAQPRTAFPEVPILACLAGNGYGTWASRSGEGGPSSVGVVAYSALKGGDRIGGGGG